jgi:hypothetical protein
MEMTADQRKYLNPQEMVQRSISHKSIHKLEFCCAAQRLRAINSALSSEEETKTRDSRAKCR